jgi:hypothetical protein
MLHCHEKAACTIALHLPAWHRATGPFNKMPFRTFHTLASDRLLDGSGLRNLAAQERGICFGSIWAEEIVEGRFPSLSLASDSRLEDPGFADILLWGSKGIEAFTASEVKKMSEHDRIQLEIFSDYI